MLFAKVPLVQLTLHTVKVSNASTTIHGSTATVGEDLFNCKGSTIIRLRKYNDSYRYHRKHKVCGSRHAQGTTKPHSNNPTGAQLCLVTVVLHALRPSRRYHDRFPLASCQYQSAGTSSSLIQRWASGELPHDGEQWYRTDTLSLPTALILVVLLEVLVLGLALALGLTMVLVLLHALCPHSAYQSYAGYKIEGFRDRAAAGLSTLM